jgi:hypothetical protein
MLQRNNSFSVAHWCWCGGVGGVVESEIRDDELLRFQCDIKGAW